MEEKKTHTERVKPQMSVRSLADYMAASEQAKRTVVRSSKYRAIARLVQHDEARLAISKYILSGSSDPQILLDQASYVRNKLADSNFDADSNDHNADYIERFASVISEVQLPSGAMPGIAHEFSALEINGVRVTFRPSVLLSKPGKKNITKRGAIMLRYEKNKALPSKTGVLQSAAIFGVLCMHGFDEESEVDKPLCATLDAHSGAVYYAPSDSVSIFNNMKAACLTISERWPNIAKPPNAVI